VTLSDERRWSWWPLAAWFGLVVCAGLPFLRFVLKVAHWDLASAWPLILAWAGLAAVLLVIIKPWRG
jgi:hypothetical protein